MNEREFRALLRRFAFEPRRVLLMSGGAALLGLLVVPATQRDPLLFLDVARGDARLYWSLGANFVLFAFLGLGFYASLLSRRLIGEVAAAIEEVDLLDLSRLAAFSRIGLRQAFGWLGGSTIASLIFLDVEVLWPVAAVIAGTLTLSTRAFLGPVRAIHLRIRDAKRAELRRVREAIAKARAAALEHSQPGAASELEGLLAWEARIDSAPEWPFDVPTLVRFGALVVIAVGSWLGGALVERALGVVLAG